MKNLLLKLIKLLFKKDKRKHIRPEDYTMLHTYTEKQLKEKN